MNTPKTATWVAVVALVVSLAVGYMFVSSRPSVPSHSGLVGAVGNQTIEQYDPYVQYNGGMNTALPVNFQSTLAVTGALTQTGAATLTGAVTTGNSITYGGALSTSTPASLTMAQSDFTSYTGILMLPTVGSITVTLPATSTLTTFLATTGQQAQYQFCNATTTASQNITLAGGTGMNVSNATTTLVVTPKKCALLNFMRTSNTDIDLMIDIGI